MKAYFAYTRVSTAKQGEGVSLQEQKAAIERYAARQGIDISEWFEERESAAKKGRPIFSKMIRRLRRGEAAGVVIHKIDRSARNLRDWAELGELIDAGAAVHFANESLDLLSRGGRLSADIQAVVAADYIRNLREETRKGFYGRLKQGLYPLPAPIGYVDKGPGKPKEIDPLHGPLVRQAFELYDTGQYSLDELAAKLRTLGLARKGGGVVYKGGLSAILHNPFYAGLIRLRSTGESFEGIHEPLVERSLFDNVQARLGGKRRSTAWKHRFLFRRLLHCQECGVVMTGERQKGHVYYRCHTKGCSTKCIREEVVDRQARKTLDSMTMPGRQLNRLRDAALRIAGSATDHRGALEQSVELQMAKIDRRLHRLTDALIDGLIDKQGFNERRSDLLADRSRLREGRATSSGLVEAAGRRIKEIFELAEEPSLSYEHASPELKRDLLKKVSSNRLVSSHGVVVELRRPFALVAEAASFSRCDPYGI